MPAQPWEPDDIDRKYCEKFGANLTQKQLADSFGITIGQLRGAFQRDPDFRALYDKSKARTIAKVADNLVQKALKGNVTCMIYYLKTQAEWRETSRVEHTGADGGPVAIETADEARREVMGRLVGIAERLAATGSLGGADGGGPGQLEGPEVRVDLLGPAGSVSSERE